MPAPTSTISENSCIVLHISQLETILYRINEVTTVVNERADILFGPEPAIESEAPKPDNNGASLIHHMNRNASEIMNAVERLEQAVERLNDL